VYDEGSRVVQNSYPTGLTIDRDYNASGYLADIRLGGTSGSQGIYWQETAADAEGHVTGETYGNGISTTRAFSPLNGLVTQIQAGTSAAVQNQSFSYDLNHNLNARSDVYGGTTVIESYTDDLLNRLTGVTGTTNGTALTAKTVSYDLTGNVTNKSDVGTYSYPAAGSHGPHAVSSIAGTLNGVVNPSFTYDADGNLTAGAGRTVTWTSFNMASTITSGTNSDTYLYGPEHQRFKETHQDGTYILFFGLGTGEPHYEQQVGLNSAWTYRYYLEVGGRTVGMVLATNTGGFSTNYFHLDHLGSVTAVTNDSAAVLQKFSYDAWGKRRNPNGTDATSPITSVVDRGYTGHEELDSVALVNANGRIYDPALGRFMSADPKVTNPFSSQSLNRYSYVANNPLTSVDPTGLEAIADDPNADGGGGGGGGGGGSGGGGGETPPPDPAPPPPDPSPEPGTGQPAPGPATPNPAQDAPPPDPSAGQPSPAPGAGQPAPSPTPAPPATVLEPITVTATSIPNNPPAFFMVDTNIFLAPSGFNFQTVWQAGRNFALQGGSSTQVGKFIGREGTFNPQKISKDQGLGYGFYQEAANIAVGVFMEGFFDGSTVGYAEMTVEGQVYGLGSTNWSPSQAGQWQELWTEGWNAGQSGSLPVQVGSPLTPTP
jgi:RHS repeat-associated protein